jgi:endonuclease/exonuclease/phosphatase family metal-dependent hydrolase
MHAGKIRLLTLNIAHGRGLSVYQGFHSADGIERNLRRIGRLLKRLAPDVVALQEVDEDSHWNRRIHLLDFLREDTGFAHSFLGVHNRREGRLPLAYGNGLLSAYPIRTAEHRAFGDAVLGEKGFVYTEIEFPEGRLPLVNLHLDFRSRRRRIEQVEHIIEYLRTRHEEGGGENFFAPIVCGDFNSRSGRTTDAVRHLFRYLEEHCEYQLFPEGVRTFPSILPRSGLDFIFVPRRHRILHAEVLRAYVSDHRPVLLDFLPGD